MENKQNYQKELERILESEKHRRPRLLLHSCCAPCSSYVLEYLSEKFLMDILFYNPNIAPMQENVRRREELERMTAHIGFSGEVLCPVADEQEFYSAVKGLEDLPEGGARCERCFRLRLQKTAEMAKVGGYDYFVTTLSISPHKNSQLINIIGAEIGHELGIKYLLSDFKKRGGYKRSLELSQQYGLYRQDYCGCRFSMRNKP